MAIVGIMESYVLGELTGDTETVAKQVGKLVKKYLVNDYVNIYGFD